MKSIPHLITIIGLTFFPFLITSCTSTNTLNNKDLLTAARAQASETEQTPDEAIKSASERIENSSSDLLFFSPIHMQQANEKLDEARKIKQKSDKSKVQTEAIATAILARQLVEEAERNATVVKETLKPALDHRNILLELESDKILPTDFQAGMDQLQLLIIDVELDNSEKIAQKQVELLQEFTSIEKKTLHKKWLTKAENTLREAQNAGAQELAPSTFLSAQTAIQAAKYHIARQYRDREGVRKQSRKAYILATQAQNVAIEVAKLNRQKPEVLESYVLEIQSFFDAINQRAGVDELVTQTFYEQSRSIAAAFPDTSLPYPGSLATTEADASTTQVETNSTPQVSEDAGRATDNVIEVSDDIALASDDTAQIIYDQNTLEPEDSAPVTTEEILNGLAATSASSPDMGGKEEEETSIEPENSSDIQEELPIQGQVPLVSTATASEIKTTPDEERSNIVQSESAQSVSDEIPHEQDDQITSLTAEEKASESHESNSTAVDNPPPEEEEENKIDITTSAPKKEESNISKSEHSEPRSQEPESKSIKDTNQS